MELFSDRLKQVIALAKRFNWMLAVMFIDLDRFKLINDMHGHAIGDRVIQRVAKRLCERVRDADTICRYGGDEFLYLLVNPRGIENVRQIALQVVDRVSKAMIINDLTLTIELSVGIAVYPEDGSTGQELVANADAAMYRAKEKKPVISFSKILKIILPKLKPSAVKGCNPYNPDFGPFP